ncbi:MAG TPA: hypothetical protein DEA22_00435 [Blastocatellia bacterium]|nr:hypothetical protein [Blastocatellia bacterium]
MIAFRKFINLGSVYGRISANSTTPSANCKMNQAQISQPRGFADIIYLCLEKFRPRAAKNFHAKTGLSKPLTE